MGFKLTCPVCGSEEIYERKEANQGREPVCIPCLRKVSQQQGEIIISRLVRGTSEDIKVPIMKPISEEELSALKSIKVILKQIKIEYREDKFTPPELSFL